MTFSNKPTLLKLALASWYWWYLMQLCIVRPVLLLPWFHPDVWWIETSFFLDYDITSQIIQWIHQRMQYNVHLLMIPAIINYSGLIVLASPAHSHLSKNYLNTATSTTNRPNIMLFKIITFGPDTEFNSVPYLHIDKGNSRNDLIWNCLFILRYLAQKLYPSLLQCMTAVYL